MGGYRWAATDGRQQMGGNGWAAIDGRLQMGGYRWAATDGRLQMGGYRWAATDEGNRWAAVSVWFILKTRLLYKLISYGRGIISMIRVQ